MMRLGFAVAPIYFTLQPPWRGTAVLEFCRQMGIGGQVFFRLRKQYSGGD
jgi:hypothetical protein